MSEEKLANVPRQVINKKDKGVKPKLVKMQVENDRGQETRSRLTVANVNKTYDLRNSKENLQKRDANDSLNTDKVKKRKVQHDSANNNVSPIKLTSFDIVDENLPHDHDFVTDGIEVEVEASDFETESDEEEEGEISDGEHETIEEFLTTKAPSSIDDEVILGATAKTLQKEKAAETDDLLQHLLKEKLKGMTREEIDKLLQDKGTNCVTPEKLTRANGATLPTRTAVKSPSDTTLYRPAFKQNAEVDQTQHLHFNKANILTPGLGINRPVVQSQSPIKMNANMLDRISNFVESIRLERRQDQPGTSSDSDHPSSQVEIPGLNLAKNKAKNAILEVEKFCASIKAPKGMLAGDGKGFIYGRQVGQSGLSDDDFFHLTCHIEDGLKQKMECGEYVDLEKLILRDVKNDNRLEWVHCEGATFLAPVNQRDSKISGVKRWDQAFRIYATFYCSANPHRAKEIWQYVDVIHTAAAAYNWDNVYKYDVTFRHLMEFNPSCSWAVTYTHMWNLSLREPISKNWFNKHNAGSSGSAGVSHNVNHQPGNNFQKGANSHSNSQSGGKKCPRYCWHFNHSEPCKYSPKCHFIE